MELQLSSRSAGHKWNSQQREKEETHAFVVVLRRAETADGMWHAYSMYNMERRATEK